MDSILKKGVLLVSLTGIMTAFPMAVHAADIDDTQNIPAAGNTQILEDCYTSDKTIPVNDHLVPEQKGEYSDMAFANVQSFLYIRSEPTTDSEWVGKLYPDYAAKITGPVGEWTKVESGNVTGYVYSRYITVGNEAQKKAEELVQNNDTGNAEDAFTYAESREEEAARLQKEQEEQKEQNDFEKLMTLYSIYLFISDTQRDHLPKPDPDFYQSCLPKELIEQVYRYFS